MHGHRGPEADAAAQPKLKRQRVGESKTGAGSRPCSESLRWFLGALSPDSFFSDVFEQKPLVIRAADGDAERAGGLFGYDGMLGIARENELFYNNSMTLCVYKDGKRETAELEGIVNADEVDRLFRKENHTVQFYRPQIFSDPIWKFNADLENDFGDHVGASVYLTPPNSQGLAPHHDDVDVFVIQTEGSKHWKIFAPLPGEELPGEHSQDLQMEMVEGENAKLKLVQDVVLHPGDRLYMPRGFVHYARTVTIDGKSTPSCHVTCSTFQQHSWTYFLMQLMPAVLGKAFSSDISFRKGLPRNYRHIAGSIAPALEHLRRAKLSEDDKERQSVGEVTGKEGTSFLTTVKELLKRALTYVDKDTVFEVCDNIANDFMKQRLPPLLPPENTGKNSVIPVQGNVVFRTVDPNYVQVSMEGNRVTLIHSLRNNRKNHMGPQIDDEDEDEDEEEEEDENESEKKEGDENKEEGDEGFVEESSTGHQHLEKLVAPQGSLVFPRKMGLAMAVLLNSYPERMDFGSFQRKVRAAGGPDGREELGALLTALWLEGVLETRTSAQICD